MEPFAYHVFICDQKKPDGVPCCSARGSGKSLEALRKELDARGLTDTVQVTACGSLGVCERGPNLVVYPQGVWYSNVTPQDVPELVRSHFQAGRPVERLMNSDAAALGAEIRANRDKMLAARRAQEAAGMLPDDLNATLRGFMESRVLLTALELDLFTAVGNGSTAEQAAKKAGSNPRATAMLMNALAAMGLLGKQGETFRNAPAAGRYFAAGSKDYARPGLLHAAHLWRSWSTLTECVRAGTAVARQESRGPVEDWTQAFIAAMHRNAGERAPLVVRTVGVERVERMVDVGGGSGAYSIAFAKANSKLHSEILDLPEVLSIAQGHIREGGLEARISTRPGDLRRDAFGGGHQLVFISAICHMLNETENLDLMKRSFQALSSGGRVVVQDFILEPDRTAPRFAALFALNMLVGTRGGSSYTEEEYAGWLREAGFSAIERVRLPGPTGLMIGTRP